MEEVEGNSSDILSLSSFSPILAPLSPPSDNIEPSFQISINSSRSHFESRPHVIAAQKASKLLSHTLERLVGNSICMDFETSYEVHISKRACLANDQIMSLKAILSSSRHAPLTMDNNESVIAAAYAHINKLEEATRDLGSSLHCLDQDINKTHISIPENNDLHMKQKQRNGEDKYEKTCLAIISNTGEIISGNERFQLIMGLNHEARQTGPTVTLKDIFHLDPSQQTSDLSMDFLFDLKSTTPSQDSMSESFSNGKKRSHSTFHGFDVDDIKWTNLYRTVISQHYSSESYQKSSVNVILGSSQQRKRLDIYVLERNDTKQKLSLPPNAKYIIYLS